MSPAASAPDFQTLFESLPGRYLVLDPQLRIVAVSDAYALATRRRRDEILGKPVFEVFPDPPNDPPAGGASICHASFERVLRDRTADAPPVQQHVVQRPDAEGGGSEERYWKPLNSPVLAADGSVAWIVHRVDDVTDLVRLESETSQHRRVIDALRENAAAALHDREARLASILRAAADAIITIDERGVIDSVNHATEQMFGYPAGELVGHNISQLMPPPYRAAHDGYLAEYRATGVKKIIGIGREVQGRRKDGTVFPADLAVSESFSGQRWFTGIVRDITDRKRAETSLREQADLLNKVTNAVMVCDMDDRITFWNHGAEGMYGWTAAEVLGKRAPEVLLPRDPKLVAEAKRQVRAHGVWEGELHKRTKDNQLIVVESHRTLLRDASGDPSGMIVIDIDVTEKKELEVKFLRAQRLESVGTLVSGIAHDLNNVLTPILMAVKLLKKDRPRSDKKELLETAQAGVERGAAFIRQLLAFAGGLEGDRVAVRIDEVVAEVRSMLNHTLPKTIRLDAELPDSCRPVLGDRTQISQVLMNLCVNARDAMPDGGTLTFRVEGVTLNGHAAALNPAAKPGPYVVVSITDTGAGIPPDVLDKIFDPFFTTKPFGQGTGLGLATVVGIVKSHRGFVNVYSEVGRGTKMMVYLPALVAEVAEPLPEAPEEVLPGHGELILLIDDEPAILAMTRATLEAYGYAVETALGGELGLSVYQQHRNEVRVVVLDMMMPGTDGVAVMVELKRIAPTVPVIAASGLKPTGRIAEAVSKHAARFLLKPFAEEALLGAIAENLRPVRSSAADPTA